MTTCRDCIHYDVCSKKHWHIEDNKYACDLNDIENRCDDFKDKSRIIELPCKVGEMVHYITFWGNEYDYHCIANASFDVLCQLLYQKEIEYVVFITDSKSKAEAKLKELNEK